MSSKAKKIGKKIEKNKLLFEEEMYYNLYGSLVVCAYMFSEKGKYDPAEINNTWKRFMKNKITFPTFCDDPNWYDRMLNVFGMERPKVFPIAFVQSKYNALFVPYVSDTVLPLREDGVSCRTIETGKVYPIDFEGEE